MDGINFLTGEINLYPSDVGDFNIGNSPIEGGFVRGPYSSKIGLFCIGRSPIGLAFTPVPDRRRVVFLLPEYPDQFEMPELEDAFTLPAPEGWSY